MIQKEFADDGLFDLYERKCRPVAQKNAHDSMQNMIGLGQVSVALGALSDLAELEARLASMTNGERKTLNDAIDTQFSHFASDGQYSQPLRESGGLPAMHWRAPYSGFTFFTENEETGAQEAAKASARAKHPIGFEGLQPADAARLPVPTATFLAWPD
jgi:hypothetical protein